MSKLEYRKLSDTEISKELTLCPGWRLNGAAIARDFEFKEYQQGLVFASHVGYLADRLNHHPDLTIGYRKVGVSISTHDVGGISPYDFELARRIDSTTA